MDFDIALQAFLTIVSVTSVACIVAADAGGVISFLSLGAPPSRGTAYAALLAIPAVQVLLLLKRRRQRRGG